MRQKKISIAKRKTPGSPGVFNCKMLFSEQRKFPDFEEFGYKSKTKNCF
jgi:hypothetical protein